MTIKRDLTVSIGSEDTTDTLEFECNSDAEGYVHVQLNGTWGGKNTSACLDLNQQEVFALREGLTAILDAIRDNAAGR